MRIASSLNILFTILPISYNTSVYAIMESLLSEYSSSTMPK